MQHIKVSFLFLKKMREQMLNKVDKYDTPRVHMLFAIDSYKLNFSKYLILYDSKKPYNINIVLINIRILI